MLVSGVQQSDSVIHIYVSIFQILFPFRLLQNIEQSTLCYTVGPCWLSILNIVVCILYFQVLKKTKHFILSWIIPVSIILGSHCDVCCF